jgi:hypothetical protein
MGPIISQEWLKLSHKNGLVTMVTQPKPSCTHVGWCKFRIHLKVERPLFVNGETTGLKMMKPTSPSIARTSS